MRVSHTSVSKGDTTDLTYTRPLQMIIIPCHSSFFIQDCLRYYSGTTSRWCFSKAASRTLETEGGDLDKKLRVFRGYLGNG
jgi:hypothetical protein